MRPFKDIDSINQSLILKAFGVFFPLISILGYVLWGLIGILYAGFTCAIIAVVSVFIAGRVGGTASTLWGGKTPIWYLSERYAADFSRARYQKMNKQFDEALRIIDQMLEEQPHYNEALFLKAQIIAEGLNDWCRARRILIQIMRLEPEDNDVYRWSQQLYKNLNF